MKRSWCGWIACCWLCAPGAVFAEEVASQEATVPGELAGIWDVEHVAVDAADQMHWKFHPDDPSVVGRQLTLEKGLIRCDISKQPNCNQEVWTRRTATWRFLVANGLLRSPSTDGYVPPTPKDYGLSVAPKKVVTLFPLCTTPSTAPDRGVEDWVTGVWVVPDGSNKMIMHLDTQTMLTLARRSPTAKPVPSFRCTKAGSPTEKAICASFTLAGWDRSVALAWHSVITNGRATTDVFDEQKKWLQERDACGSDAACLETKMSQRVQDLETK